MRNDRQGSCCRVFGRQQHFPFEIKAVALLPCCREMCAHKWGSYEYMNHGNSGNRATAPWSSIIIYNNIIDIYSYRAVARAVAAVAAVADRNTRHRREISSAFDGPKNFYTNGSNAIDRTIRAPVAIPPIPSDDGRQVSGLPSAPPMMGRGFRQRQRRQPPTALASGADFLLA